MDKKMNFKYFYGTEADQFSFYRIPKALFTNDYFKDLSSDAKILYGLMLDRMSLSIKNQWFDEENRAYIYFSIEDIMELYERRKRVFYMSEKRCYTVKEIQEILDVSRPTVYALLKKKEFRWIQLDGGKYRISKKSFDDWLDKQPE